MKGYEPYYKEDGLSRTERTILIESCSKDEYKELKAKAVKAIKQRKVFIISGGKFENSLLRKLLVDRGWVEKIPADAARRTRDNEEEMNSDDRLKRLLLSILVESAKPNFIWYCDNGYHATAPHTLINRFRNEGTWATKEGLCGSLKKSRWYHIDDVADVIYPRTYLSANKADRAKFEEDYKITACSSLLKWIRVMATENTPIFTSSGKIPPTTIHFALSGCKEYLARKQNKDIDNQCCNTTEDKWDIFLANYYALVTKKDEFMAETDEKVTEYLASAEYLLEKMYKYRPQLSCDGYLNIWIVKPAQNSQGRGITMESKLDVLSTSVNRGVFQKYIEEPLLIHETKFDIRQYYVVTNTIPLEIWMYKRCYLKFSTQKYSLQNFHESIHLTNYAVQRNYSNCDDRHPELLNTNMWSLTTFKEYLRKQGKEHIWDNIIYRGMRKTIVGVMLCSQEATITFDDQRRFQIYGCDFVLDKDYKPWLIEINAKPDLNPTTTITADICPAVISDMVKVVFDRAANKNAATGDFELIFRQNLGPSHVVVGDLTVYGHALPLSYFYKGPQQAEESDETDDDIPSQLQSLSSISIY